MRREQVEDQAEMLAAYERKGGRREEWFRSKGFSTLDRLAILRQLPSAQRRLDEPHAGLERFAGLVKRHLGGGKR